MSQPNGERHYRGGNEAPSQEPPVSTRRVIVTEDDIHNALQLLTGPSCDDLGAARAAVSMAEHMLKRARSIKVLQSAMKSADLREAEAIASDEYLAQVRKLAAATLKSETLYARRRGAEAMISAYQTMEASRRAARI